MPPETLLRPLGLDLLFFVWPLVVGMAAFLLGRWFHRWSIIVRAGLIGCTVGLICVAAALLFHAIPRPVDLAFSYVGGVIIVLCWMFLGVIGFSWASRPAPDFFLRYVMVILPLILIAVESGGSLWFRFCAIESWRNYTVESGTLTQRTKMTCLPASSVMLLHQYGFEGISEGELAYLANTTFFGTDGHSMARVITQKIGRPGVSAHLATPTFDELVERGLPFIAQVQLEKIGNHSVFVKKITPNMLLWVDPQQGFDHFISPQDFQHVWTGRPVLIDGIEPRPSENEAGLNR